MYRVLPLVAALLCATPVASAAPGSACPEPPPDRTLEYVTLGAAVAATVTGLIVWLDAHSQAAELTEQAPTPRRAERVAELYGRQQMAAGATLAGVALTGLTAWLAFRPDPQSTTPLPSASVTPGGALFGLRGRF